MTLGLTHPLTEMSTRNISWEGGKGGRCMGLTTLPPSCADCSEILGASNSWNPQGLSGLVIELLYLLYLLSLTNTAVDFVYAWRCIESFHLKEQSVLVLFPRHFLSRVLLRDGPLTDMSNRNIFWGVKMAGA